MGRSDEQDFAALPLRDDGQGTVIPIRAVPRAGRDALDGMAEGALRVRLAAPPVEGAANQALLAFMAGALGVPKRDLSLLAGERGRQKLLRVRGLAPDEVRRRLGAWAGRR